MHEVAEKAVGWLVLGGIILAVLAARGRYKGKFAASVAAAHAAGYAAAKVDLGVSQTVNVQAGNTAHGVPVGEHRCADPFACEVCSAVLLRVLRAGGRGGAPALTGSGVSDTHDDVHYDDDNGSARYVERRTDFDTGGVVTYERRSVASHRDAGGDGADPGGVEGVPRAPLNGEVSELRPELLADMARRPWAYDEADPRFERGVPVANGRRGRGPGR